MSFIQNERANGLTLLPAILLDSHLRVKLAAFLGELP